MLKAKLCIQFCIIQSIFVQIEEIEEGDDSAPVAAAPDGLVQPVPTASDATVIINSDQNGELRSLSCTLSSCCRDSSLRSMLHF